MRKRALLERQKAELVSAKARKGTLDAELRQAEAAAEQQQQRIEQGKAELVAQLTFAVEDVVNVACVERRCMCQAY